jgi:thioredoxin 1
MLTKEVLSRDELQEKLEIQDKTVVINFGSETNGPCKVMKSVLDYFSGQYSDEVSIIKVDVERNPELAEEYDVRTLPTMVIYKNGIEQEDRILGTVPFSVMVDAIIREEI